MPRGVEWFSGSPFPWLPAFSPEPLYPNATFSDPEVAQVGLTPKAVAETYHPKLVQTIRFDLSKTDKGYTEALKYGFIEVSAMRLTGRILGATIVGPRASEMISFFTLAMTPKYLTVLHVPPGISVPNPVGGDPENRRPICARNLPRVAQRTV